MNFGTVLSTLFLFLSPYAQPPSHKVSTTVLVVLSLSFCPSLSFYFSFSFYFSLSCSCLSGFIWKCILNKYKGDRMCNLSTHLTATWEYCLTCFQFHQCSTSVFNGFQTMVCYIQVVCTEMEHLSVHNHGVYRTWIIASEWMKETPRNIASMDLCRIIMEIWFYNGTHIVAHGSLCIVPAIHHHIT